MKVFSYDDVYVLFLNSWNMKEMNWEDKKEVSSYVKELILKMKDIYFILLKGFYKVHIYENKKIGMILEFLKVHDDTFGLEDIDLKVSVNKEYPFLLKTTCFDILSSFPWFYFYKEEYYIPVSMLDENNFIYYEFFELIYKDVDNIIKKGKKVIRNE